MKTLQRTRVITSSDDRLIANEVNQHLAGEGISAEDIISISENLFEESQSTEFSSMPGIPKMSITIWYKVSNCIGEEGG